jgi:hypothetical protein
VAKFLGLEQGSLHPIKRKVICQAKIRRTPDMIGFLCALRLRMKRKMATKPKKSSGGHKAPETAIAHATHKDGKQHAIAVMNLHVLIVPDGKYWFAQGLEIDYAVQGDSVEDVKKQFETGFRATIYQHLKIFGHIGNMLRVAPNDVWQEYLTTPKAQKVFSHASMHKVVPDLNTTHPDLLQFEQIEYAELSGPVIQAAKVAELVNA